MRDKVEGWGITTAALSHTGELPGIENQIYIWNRELREMLETRLREKQASQHLFF